MVVVPLPCNIPNQLYFVDIQLMKDILSVGEGLGVQVFSNFLFYTSLICFRD